MIETKEQARSFCDDLAAMVDALIRTLDEESRLVREAKLADAAALTVKKTALAARYGEALGALRDNAARLSRLSPVEIDGLRQRQQALESALQTNLAVLATARTVSETLIRGVAEMVAERRKGPDTYGADAKPTAHGPRTAPIRVSVAL